MDTHLADLSIEARVLKLEEVIAEATGTIQDVDILTALLDYTYMADALGVAYSTHLSSEQIFGNIRKIVRPLLDDATAFV